MSGMFLDLALDPRQGKGSKGLSSESAMITRMDIVVYTLYKDDNSQTK